MSYHWQCITESAPFRGRDGAGALVYQDAMWLIGGWSKVKKDRAYFPRTCVNDVWRSTDGQHWDLIKPNSFLDQTFDPRADWEGRHTAGYATWRGRMWILGGDANQGHYQPDIWSSADGRHWQLELAEAPWGNRCHQHTVVFRDRLWVIGGQTMPEFVAGSDDSFFRDVWVSDDGRNWQQLAPREPFWPQRGMIGRWAVHQDRLWLIGGGTYDTPNNPDRRVYNDVWSTTDGITWTCHTQAAPWPPRQYHEVAAWDGKLWLLEGYSPATHNLNDVWYSTDGSHWTQVPDTPWAPRHAASVFVYQDALWMVAGNNMFPDVWKLVRDT